MISESVKDLIKNKKLLLCVSGGIDSMVLFHYFNSIKTELNIDISVCHFEHGIRGEDSFFDMEFVKKTCQEKNIPIYIKRENILGTANGENIEGFARERRYKFFYETKENINADYIVVAHHTMDNAETVLMNVIRGCGSSGLCGMATLNGCILRPLLHLSKQDIIDYANNNNVEFREDATNYDENYLRNNIRHSIIPTLEKINPKFVNSIGRLSSAMQEENDFLNEYIESQKWIEKTFYGYDILVKDFKGSHIAIKKRAIFYVFKSMLGKDFDSKTFNDIIELFDKETGKKIILNKEIIAYKCYDKVAFYKVKEAITDEYKLSLGENETPFGKFTLSIVETDMDEIKKAPLNVAYFDDKIENLSVRKRKDGDVFETFSGNTKKVKDIMIDKKVEGFLRDSYPLIMCKDAIIFMPYICHGGKEKVTGKKALKIEFAF